MFTIQTILLCDPHLHAGKKNQIKAELGERQKLGKMQLRSRQSVRSMSCKWYILGYLFKMFSMILFLKP